MQTYSSIERKAFSDFQNHEKRGRNMEMYVKNEVLCMTFSWIKFDPTFITTNSFLRLSNTLSLVALGGKFDSSNDFSKSSKDFFHISEIFIHCPQILDVASEEGDNPPNPE